MSLIIMFLILISCFIFQLFLMICMQKWSTEQNKEHFSIEFMVWEVFFNAIMYPGNNSELLRHVSKADLVIGGVDMSISYL